MGETVPGLGDDDVVEGRVGFAEAGEADFDDHWGGLGVGGWEWGRDGRLRF